MSRSDHFLFVEICLAGVRLAEEIEVRLADGLDGVRQTETQGQSAINTDKTTLTIFEIDCVVDVVHQHVQQFALGNARHGLLLMLGRVQLSTVATRSHKRFTPSAALS